MGAGEARSMQERALVGAKSVSESRVACSRPFTEKPTKLIIIKTIKVVVSTNAGWYGLCKLKEEANVYYTTSAGCSREIFSHENDTSSTYEQILI